MANAFLSILRIFFNVFKWVLVAVAVAIAPIIIMCLYVLLRCYQETAFSQAKNTPYSFQIQQKAERIKTALHRFPETDNTGQVKRKS